jgi:hypothetical protein
MSQPRNIAEVIDQLERIVADSQTSGEREGYFAVLYLRVTRAVQAKIKDGFFDNNPRMEQLDVIFASRYLTAYDQHKHHQKCSASWQVAFAACRNWRPLVLQHLLLGMNAHIGLDLGIAAATVCPGQTIQILEDDFNKINTILAMLVNTVEAELADLWPLLKPINWLAGKLDEKLAVFSMDIARDAAWEVALQYAILTTPVQREAFIRNRDERVAVFGKKVAQPGFMLNSLIGILRAFERGSVADKIGVLDEKTENVEALHTVRT